MLAAHGLRPSRLRGQHFLVDGNLIDAIVRRADVGPEDAVLEVGTGTGILTDALAGRAGRVVSVDLDERLQAIARGLRDWPASVEFLVADVLEGKHRLNPEVLEAWDAAASSGLRRRLVANLPYGVATPLLANLLWDGVGFDDAVVLVQKEAADRFLARPGSAAYGPISVVAGLFSEAGALGPVPPQVFWPQPKVDSTLLRLRPLDPVRARSLRDAGLPGLLRQAFSQRRKMLRKRIDPARLAAAGIDPRARPQDLAPEAWPALLTVPPS